MSADSVANRPGGDDVVPNVGRGFGGHIAKTIRESTPWWPTPPAPAAQSPNVVMILLDDMGFSDFGCFGGEIATPAVDRATDGAPARFRASSDRTPETPGRPRTA